MSTAILLRTHYMDDRLRSFASRLSDESGFEVYLLADETVKPIDCRGFPKLVLTPRVVADLNLYCPRDFGWRCGDYGFYLARRSLPDVKFFWMIEPDTRPNWESYRALFDLFDSEQADFIAPHYRQVGKEDFWFPTMRWRSPFVWRCLFGFSRLSATAADICWQERIRSRRRLDARLVWPNDETFVATTIAARGLIGKDLNEVHPGLCTTDSFDFYTPKSGEAFENLEPDKLIYHPVLYGAMYSRKIESIRAISGSTSTTFKQRGERARLQALRGWYKVRGGAIPGWS